MAEGPAESRKKKNLTIHSTRPPTTAYHCLAEKKRDRWKKLSIDQINSFTNPFKDGGGNRAGTIKFQREYKSITHDLQRNPRWPLLSNSHNSHV